MREVALIGTDFYVMDYVPDRILMDASLPGVSPQHRARVYDDFGAALAKLHQVDFEAVGLGDWARPGDYIDRQLSRFAKQYRSAETEPIPAMEALIKSHPAGVRQDRLNNLQLKTRLLAPALQFGRHKDT